MNAPQRIAASRQDAPKTAVTVGYDGLATHVREVAGLTLPQRYFLLERLRYDTDKACALALGLHHETPGNWKRESPVFAAEYAALLEQGTAALAAQVQEEIGRMAGLVPATIVQLLTAEDPIVDRNGNVVGTMPAWKARKDGLEVLSRWLDRWNGTPAVSQDNESAAQLRRIADTLEAARQQSNRPAAAISDGAIDGAIIEATAVEVTSDGPGARDGEGQQ